VNNWVELSSERLAANYRVLVEAAGAGVSVLAVVKANGYGHGAALCAEVLAQAGATWLGVTDAAEGAAVLGSLTAVEPPPRILVMSGLLAEDAPAIIEHNLTAVVWTIEQLQWLVEAAARAGETRPLRVHLEIDTGMSRQGVAPGAELEHLLGWLAAHPQIVLDGVLTHFASAEICGSPQTEQQRERFEQASRAVASSGLRPRCMHASNTSVIDNCELPDHHAWLTQLASEFGAEPMVRSGLGLYGYSLPIERATRFSGPLSAKVHCRLKPVMTWKARLIGVRELAAGDAIGYNGIFVAERPMRIALLPVGYADGLRRELSSGNACPGGWVMIHGQRAPIVGRISMNLTTVDVTGITNISAGDEVTVLGEGITAEDHAKLARTIPYEILCGVRAGARLV
jgi:alanine racemase